jgi:hypothetical protein
VNLGEGLLRLAAQRAQLADLESWIQSTILINRIVLCFNDDF